MHLDSCLLWQSVTELITCTDTSGQLLPRKSDSAAQLVRYICRRAAMCLPAATLTGQIHLGPDAYEQPPQGLDCVRCIWPAAHPLPSLSDTSAATLTGQIHLGPDAYEQPPQGLDCVRCIWPAAHLHQFENTRATLDNIGIQIHLAIKQYNHIKICIRHHAHD
ncbi:uncharacterized protein MELLADRAFT_110491 [Melampsora larici-populina 98AG31]|uniref:Uncharacterized protein n=1 Tax=Melampsora larici-populina (strain 98AG31 / pathotype 3-4-7) TaxID=747676 RepID=F4RZZ6_MELLP|nr:uncharacterized protein MELLADRAFT_110491 [Melampsora larici-populina 98AG31]EGG02089.1 hypothetical protein MELLADRAFT_110491 [Melampsora larici-populina 98AG31]